MLNNCFSKVKASMVSMSWIDCAMLIVIIVEVWAQLALVRAVTLKWRSPDSLLSEVTQPNKSRLSETRTPDGIADRVRSPTHLWTLQTTANRGSHRARRGWRRRPWEWRWLARGDWRPWRPPGRPCTGRRRCRWRGSCGGSLRAGPSCWPVSTGSSDGAGWSTPGTSLARRLTRLRLRSTPPCSLAAGAACRASGLRLRARSESIICALFMIIVW